MKRITLTVLVIVLALSAFALTGCGGNKDKDAKDGSWQYIKDNGKLVIGLDDQFAPMGFRDKDDNLVGFDIDLGNAVCKELGVKAEFKPINWDSKELELKSKNADCVWNGMSVTPERQKAMSLSKKYINNKLVIMALKKDVKIEKAEDLSKYKIGTQAGSSGFCSGSGSW